MVTTFLQEDARDPRIGFVTVTGVEITPDLARAVVRFVVHGGEAERQQTLVGLAHAAVAIRRRLAGTLRLRAVPDVVFEPDLGLEQAERIERLLASIRKPEGESA